MNQEVTAIQPSVMSKMSEAALSPVRGSSSIYTSTYQPEASTVGPSIDIPRSEMAMENMQPIVNVHQDSGVRMPPVVDVPPVYSDT